LTQSTFGYLLNPQGKQHAIHWFTCVQIWAVKLAERPLHYIDKANVGSNFCFMVLMQHFTGSARLGQVLTLLNKPAVRLLLAWRRLDSVQGDFAQTEFVFYSVCEQHAAASSR
jgi:hypothetical protein